MSFTCCLPAAGDSLSYRLRIRTKLELISATNPNSEHQKQGSMSMFSVGKQAVSTDMARGPNLVDNFFWKCVVNWPSWTTDC